MKVVLFCGGLGLRMREASERVPKPMVPIGSRPILWHVMKYFAHYGHTRVHPLPRLQGRGDQGLLPELQRGAVERLRAHPGRHARSTLLRHDIQDWEITFVDTGLHSLIGERLRLVRPHLEGEEYFLANYGDVLTDAPLDRLIDDAKARDVVASFLSIKPNYSFHLAETDDERYVKAMQRDRRADLWINGGYFVFKQELFDYINAGRGARDRAVRAARSRSASCSRTSTTASGRRWTRSRTSRRSSRCAKPATAPWKVWEIDHEAGAPATSAA